MSTVRMLLALSLLASTAACTASSNSADDGAESQGADYTRTSELLYQCRTATGADLGDPLLTGASVAVSRGIGKDAARQSVSANLSIALTREEDAALREAHPYEFQGGAIGAGGTGNPEATRVDQHYASADGNVVLDMTLTTAGAVTDGSGVATVNVDFGAPNVILPERIKALGKRSYRITLGACHKQAGA